MNVSSDNSSAPHDNTPQGVSLGVTIGTLCGAFAFLLLIGLVIYFLRKKLCYATPLHDDHNNNNNYPVADPIPPPIMLNRDVEGAVMVDANNRSFLHNNSIALTLVRSSSSSSCSGSSFATNDRNKEYEDGNTFGKNRTLTEETITVANGITAVNSPLRPLTSHLRPRYPTEIVDNSTNSVYKLYKRRSSALVYGSSTYNTINESMDMIAHRFGTTERIDEMQNNNDNNDNNNREEGVIHLNSVNLHSGIVDNITAERREKTEVVFVNNEEEEKEEKKETSSNEPF